jgi:hypothetical protein
LDGDGFVGGRDFVISKIFDKDGDGKLNAEERKAADEAVRNVSISFGILNRQEPKDLSEFCNAEEYL